MIKISTFYGFPLSQKKQMKFEILKCRWLARVDSCSVLLRKRHPSGC